MGIKSNNYIIIKAPFSVTFLLYFCLMSCSKNSLEGTYLDLNNKLIYEFNTSELIIYNITDSIKNTYAIEVEKNEIKIKNKNYEINYVIEKDSLWLIDIDYGFINSSEIKLLKFQFKNSLDLKFLHSNYWHTTSSNLKVDFWFKFNRDGQNRVGDFYEKEKSKNIHFDHSFDFYELLYFDKFHIYRFNSYVLEPYEYLLINIEKDSLKFLGIDTFKELNLNLYTSKINKQLYGTWVNSGSTNNLTIYDLKSRFYFGDTIIFNKNNNFFRRLRKDENFYYKDSAISNQNDHFKFKNNPINFQIGLDSKFLFFEKPINNVLKIQKLTKDSLIINHESYGIKKIMKYTRSYTPLR